MEAIPEGFRGKEFDELKGLVNNDED